MRENELPATDSSVFAAYLMEYEHVPWMLFAKSDPRAIIQTLNNAAAEPAVLNVDSRIEVACRLYAAASEPQRAAYRQVVRNGWSLLHYAHRMANRALCTGDVECIHLGLLALSLEGLRSDYRETVTYLAALRHVASRINVDWSAAAREVMKLSSSEMAECIEKSLARGTCVDSLELFLLRETRDQNGPRIDFFGFE
jgi:hypothetical protein